MERMSKATRERLSVLDVEFHNGWMSAHQQLGIARQEGSSNKPWNVLAALRYVTYAVDVAVEAIQLSDSSTWTSNRNVALALQSKLETHIALMMISANVATGDSYLPVGLRDN